MSKHNPEGPWYRHFRAYGHVALSLAALPVEQDLDVEYPVDIIEFSLFPKEWIPLRNRLVVVGLAFCHHSDPGSKKTGAELALARAEKTHQEILALREHQKIIHNGFVLNSRGRYIFDAQYNNDAMRKFIRTLRQHEIYSGNGKAYNQYRNAFFGFALKDT